MLKMPEYLSIPTIIVFLGALLSGIGAFWAAVKQSKDSAKTAQERLEFEKELRSKSEEIAELNKKIAASVTGGDSYCYFDIANFGPNNTAIAIIIHQGDFPIYDVSISITDLDEFAQLSKSKANLTLEDLASARNNIPIGTMLPYQAKPFKTIKLPNRETVNYGIAIAARNGTFTEEIRLKKIKGKWTKAMKVERDNYSPNNPDAKPTLLKEEIYPDYPKDKDGKIIWYEMEKD